MYCSDFSRPIIIDCVLDGNHADSRGGGVYGTDSASVTIQNSIVRNNVAGGSGGGLLFQDL